MIVELEPHDDGALVVFSERGQRGSFGLGIPDPAIPRAAVLAAWADQLQEQFLSETRGAWGGPGPRGSNARRVLEDGPPRVRVVGEQWHQEFGVSKKLVVWLSQPAR